MNWLERMIQFKEKATKQGTQWYSFLLIYKNIIHRTEILLYYKVSYNCLSHFCFTLVFLYLWNQIYKSPVRAEYDFDFYLIQSISIFIKLFTINL